VVNGGLHRRCAPPLPHLYAVEVEEEEVLLLIIGSIVTSSSSSARRRRSIHEEEEEQTQRRRRRRLYRLEEEVTDTCIVPLHCRWTYPTEEEEGG